MTIVVSFQERRRLKMDAFTGDHRKWNKWHGRFTTMIDKQLLLVAEKVTHLQTLAIGNANEAVAVVSCNHDLYQSATKATMWTPRYLC